MEPLISRSVTKDTQYVPAPIFQPSPLSPYQSGATFAARLIGALNSTFPGMLPPSAWMLIVTFPAPPP